MKRGVLKGILRGIPKEKEIPGVRKRYSRQELAPLDLEKSGDLVEQRKGEESLVNSVEESSRKEESPRKMKSSVKIERERLHFFFKLVKTSKCGA